MTEEYALMITLLTLAVVWICHREILIILYFLMMGCALIFGVLLAITQSIWRVIRGK